MIYKSYSYRDSYTNCVCDVTGANAALKLSFSIKKDNLI